MSAIILFGSISQSSIYARVSITLPTYIYTFFMCLPIATIYHIRIIQPIYMIYDSILCFGKAQDTLKAFSLIQAQIDEMSGHISCSKCRSVIIWNKSPHLSEPGSDIDIRSKPITFKRHLTSNAELKWSFYERISEIDRRHHPSPRMTTRIDRHGAIPEDTPV